MSYAMTHLIIANEYAKKNHINNRGLFLLANISPDAVHAKTDFTKSMKEKSHFLQEGIEWGCIFEEEPMQKWYQELGDFYRPRMNDVKNEKEQDFLNGYAMHILIDIFSCQLLYAPVLKKYGNDMETFRKEYRKQCLMWDNHLYESYSESAAMMEQMKDALGELDDKDILDKLKLSSAISFQNVADNLFYTIRQYENKQVDFKESVYMISQESSDYLIEYIEKQCEKLLFDFPDIGRLFKMPFTQKQGA